MEVRRAVREPEQGHIKYELSKISASQMTAIVPGLRPEHPRSP
jgi:hypothetical protein